MALVFPRHGHHADVDMAAAAAAHHGHSHGAAAMVFQNSLQTPL